MAKNKSVAPVRNGRGRPAADPNETPRSRFVRICTRRTHDVLRGLKYLENLTLTVKETNKDEKGHGGYFSTPEDWEKVLRAINRRIETLNVAIKNRKPSNGEAFSLKQ